MNTMNAAILALHHRDTDHAEKVSSIVECPLAIPSLERQVWHDTEEPFLSDGYDWVDKPHRVLDKAIAEIRALREHIIKSTAEHDSH